MLFLQTEGRGERHSLERVFRRGGSNIFGELLANKSFLEALAMCMYNGQGACAAQMNQFSVWLLSFFFPGCGTSFDFHKKIDYLFLVGTEEGKIYKVRMVSFSLVLHPLTHACLSGSSSELFAQTATKYNFRGWSCPQITVVSLTPTQSPIGSQGALCTDPIKALFCRNVFHANCVPECFADCSCASEALTMIRAEVKRHQSSVLMTVGKWQEKSHLFSFLDLLWAVKQTKPFFPVD